MSLAFLLTSFILAPGLRDTLNCGDYQLVVDGDMSARIISFRFKGTELLMQSDVHPFSYGSTLWYSPHTWNWPPPSALDGEPYMMTRKPNELVGTSREDQSIGLQFVKKFRFDLADSSLVLSYQVKNLGDSSIYASLWEVTRVHGALSFFPVANDPLGIESFNALKSVKKSSGVCWYEFHPDSVKRAQKLYEDGKEGWLAHKNGDMLFLKTFQDLNQDEIPPGHGEVEIYAHKNGLYVELENHSQFQSLAPGDSFRYTVRWYFKPIPDEIKADSGSQQLVDWVRQLANRTARQ